MKYALVCLFSLISVTLQAAPGDTSDLPANGGLGSNDVSPKYGVISGDDENADRLLKIPEVQNIYKDCKANRPNDAIQTCLWDEISKDENKAIKEKVLKEYDDMQIGEKGSDKKIYEGRNYSNVKNLNIGQKPGTAGDDASLSPKQKLEKFLFQKYLEALYGKQNGEKKLMMDHTLFYKMYKSQLGKNLISSISAFTFDSIEKAGVCLIPEGDELKKAREENLKKLEQQAQIQTDPKKDAENSSQGYGQWLTCFGQIEKLCTASSAEFAKVETADKDFFKNRPNMQADTQKRACLTYRYVKDVRQALINVKDIEKKLESYEDENAVNAFSSNMEVNKFDNLDDMMAVSSKELVEESGMDDAYKARAEELKQCQESGDMGSDICKKYLVENPEAKDKLLAEFALRSGAQVDRIGSDLDKDKDKDKNNLRKYLQEEGRTEEQINAILAQTDDKLEELRNKIKEKHKAERQQIMASLVDKIDERSLKDDASEDAKKAKFGKIKEEFDNRPDYLKQVVFFNNVVSSFIDIQSSDGKNMKNTAALNRELKNSVFGDNRAPAGSSGPTLPSVDISKIQEIAPKDSGSSGRSEGASLDVGVINEKIIIIPTPDPKNP